MYNTWSSINDPMFFMHHANIDRMWYIWQKSGPSTRLVDVTAYTYPNQTGALTNLNTVLDMGQFLAPSLPIKSVVDTLNTNGQGILCYNYESYPQH
jgi:tyrosinase